MLLKYTTGKLPPNFFMLGFTFIIIGIISIYNSDYFGLIFLLLAIPFLFIRLGVMIDSQQKQIKKYTGFFGLKMGKWVSIAQIKSIQIIRVQEGASMAVLSINRSETNISFKIILLMPNKKLELMSGSEEFISASAKEIASNLNIPLKFPKSL
ncbi:hypothetical protein ACT3CE_07480 [Marinifilum sp. RC60d5]|uniref:hypothetical protein n=1 Tax=Marinifilum sp. RC60d5 TaxID=3458414 RepID=UPI004036CB73